MVDTIKLNQYVLLDYGRFNVGSLKAYCIDEELLLGRSEGVVEETRLGPHIAESWRQGTVQWTRNHPVGCCEKAIIDSLVGLLGEAVIESVRGVSSCVERNEVLPGAITVIVMDWHSWPVNRKLLKVWSSMAI